MLRNRLSDKFTPESNVDVSANGIRRTKRDASPFRAQRDMRIRHHRARVCDARRDIKLINAGKTLNVLAHKREVRRIFLPPFPSRSLSAPRPMPSSSPPPLPAVLG
jgi:hypothetical protein